jgi:hypothetical protein
MLRLSAAGLLALLTAAPAAADEPVARLLQELAEREGVQLSGPLPTGSVPEVPSGSPADRIARLLRGTDHVVVTRGGRPVRIVLRGASGVPDTPPATDSRPGPPSDRRWTARDD